MRVSRNKPAVMPGAQAVVEIVPAILRTTYEMIAADWDLVRDVSAHIQIDITDGVFAGDGTFRQVRQFKRLPKSEKIELHMMVQQPAMYVEDIIDLNPARCVFHLESFGGQGEVRLIYEKLRDSTQAELALALNPGSPNERLIEYLELLDYVMFMGVNPGRTGAELDGRVYQKIGAFKDKAPQMPIAVDGHVNKETVPYFVAAGARILCANTAIFGAGNPVENINQLQLLSRAALVD